MVYGLNMTRTFISWFKTLFGICILLLLFSSINLQAEQIKKPIKIVSPNDPPFYFSLRNGDKTGYYVEFWRLWSKTTGLPIEFEITTMDIALEYAKNNEAVIAGLFINENRKQWADFSLPFHRVKTGILYNNKISKTSKLASHKNIRVAVYYGTYQAEYIKKHYPSLKLHYYKSTVDGINMLLNSEVDALIGELPSLNSNLAKLELTGVFTLSDEILLENEVHATLGKGQDELLSTINRGLENIPIELIIELEKKWLPLHKSFFKNKANLSTLTLAEINWLQRNQSFSAGISLASYPFGFLNSDEVVDGIVADYTQAISELLNININYIKSNSWENSFEQFQLGNIDIMLDIIKTPERAKKIKFSESYFESHTAIATKKNTFYAEDMNDLNNKIVGVQPGYAFELVGNNHPEIDIKLMSSVQEGLEKLHNGEIDAFIEAIAIINYEIERAQYTDIHITGFTPYKFELSIAVRKGLEPLVPIFNKVIASMSDKQKATIANSWLSIKVQSGVETKTILLWVLPITTLVLIIILYILYINKRLKTEISSRIVSDEERQKIESQFHQSQKMEALGKLTGGIAHDFNNLLGIIMGYSELLKNLQNDPAKLSDYANHIHHAGERGSKLTKKLLSFTKKQSSNAEVLDINTLLLQQQDVLQKYLTARINLSLDLDDAIWSVLLDFSDLEDTILNLSINAMHAMDDVTNAELTIKTCNQSINNIEAKMLGLTEGDYVLLSVTDIGCGMDEVIKGKIFEPYFSTKGDEGSGLGLSQVFAFLQRSGGAINVLSEPNHGTQIVLYFPRLQVEADLDISVIAKDENDLKGNEVILVVDDEELLCEFAMELLCEQGYQVFSATSGIDALKKLAEENIDLMVTDIIMPEMDGHQLAAQVLKDSPNMKVQLVSGFNYDAHSELVDQMLIKNILHKPYTSEELLKCVRSFFQK